MANKKQSKRNGKVKAVKKPLIENEILLYIYGLILITISLIGVLSVGLVGTFLNHAMRYIVGELCPLIYLLIILATLYYMIKKSFSSIAKRYLVGGILCCLILLTFLSTLLETNETGMKIMDYYTRNTALIFNGTFKVGGGIIGALLYSLSSLAFAKTGTYIVLSMLFIFMLLIVLSTNAKQSLGTGIVNGFKGIAKLFKRKDVKPIKYDKEAEIFDYEVESETGEDFADLLTHPLTRKTSNFIDVDDVIGTKKESKDKGGYEKQSVVVKEPKEAPYTENFNTYTLPKLTLLNAAVKSSKNSVNAGAANEAGKRLIHILAQFGVNVDLVATHVGPSVTKFELKPEMGVRVNRISNLQQDIKMGLAAKDIRIEAPIPGKSTVGIEIPNQEKTIVNMRDLMRQIPENSEHKKLLFALGKDLMGNCVYGELNKMPHLLIAGATGSGKSVCVNSIITSILMRAKPDEVKLLLVDPKKVEFSQYANIPHLIGPLITDSEEASRALKVVVKMMEDRYEVFSKVGVRNISGYNDYIQGNNEPLEKMPWIVVIIDELADLMLVAAKDVEASIQRITQLARAAGIHLVVATQRPSVDVITGVIKANIPSRIAFAVSSAIDSRTILDQQGAEKLLGLGDMLYIPQGENNPIRVQGCFVSDEEVRKIATFCSNQAKPHYEDTFIRLEEVDRTMSGEANDPLYEDVMRFVIESHKASTSFIQRKFAIGYSRAARLIDILEAQGIIGPANGSKPREVYVRNKNDLEEE